MFLFDAQRESPETLALQSVQQAANAFAEKFRSEARIWIISRSPGSKKEINLEVRVEFLAHKEHTRLDLSQFLAWLEQEGIFWTGTQLSFNEGKLIDAVLLQLSVLATELVVPAHATQLVGINGHLSIATLNVTELTVELLYFIQNWNVEHSQEIASVTV